MRLESSEAGKLRFCQRAVALFPLGALVEVWQYTRKWQPFCVVMARHKILLARFMFLVVHHWQSGAGRLVSEAKSYPSKPCRKNPFVL